MTIGPNKGSVFVYPHFIMFDSNNNVCLRRFFEAACNTVSDYVFITRPLTHAKS